MAAKDDVPNGFTTLKWALVIIISLFASSMGISWATISTLTRDLKETETKVAATVARHEEVLRRCDNMEKNQNELHKEVKDINHKVDQLLFRYK